MTLSIHSLIGRAARLISAAVLVLLLAAGPSHAQISMTLDQSALAAAPGATVTFTGTIANSSMTDTLFLNSFHDDGSLPAGVTLDGTPFFFSVPASLAPGAVYQGDIFAVSIDPSATEGDAAAVFTIGGGLDSAAGSDLASSPFSVTVVPAPEPSQYAVFTVGLLGLGVLALKARKRLPSA